MRIVFHRDIYNPAVYGQAFDGDVKDIPDDIAASLIKRDLASEWYATPPIESVGAPASGPGSISCIMPTRNRRKWVPRAIECFLSQTYAARELIVLDNGESVADLIPRDARIRYMRISDNHKTGQLRNFCCQLSQAEFIAHWDDDDWSHPERLAEQIEAIGDQAVTGYRTILFAGDTGVFKYSGEQNYALGTSLLYRRSWWAEHRFPAEMTGEDAAFVTRAQGNIVITNGLARIVASIHDSHTSPRSITGPAWSQASTDDLPKEYRA